MMFFIFPLVSLAVHGSIYHVSDNPSRSYQCPPNGLNCTIYCDVADNGYSNIYDCHDAMNCHFHCDQALCGAQSVINAQNATNLYITQTATGQQCLQYANVTTPNYGNAYFFTQANNSFNNMNVYAGIHANEIIIDTSNDYGEYGSTLYVKQMKIYAATASYVSITIGAGVEWRSATIQCPIHYGQDIASCVIHATNGSLTNITIIAPDGLSNNVQIDGCMKCMDVKIVCHDSCDKYLSGTTTAPTLEPTFEPTQTPAIQPTFIIHVVVPPMSHISSQQPSNEITLAPQSSYWGHKKDWVIFGTVCTVIWLMICICWFMHNKGANIPMTPRFGTRIRKSAVAEPVHGNIRKDSSHNEAEEKEQSTISDQDLSEISDVKTEEITQREKIKSWMKHKVHLEEYTSVLFYNGFDNINSLMEMSMDDLQQMGITKLGHRMIILKKVKLLEH